MENFTKYIFIFVTLWYIIERDKNNKFSWWKVCIIVRVYC